MTTTTHNDHSRHARSDSHPSSGFRKDSNSGFRSHSHRNGGFRNENRRDTGSSNPGSRNNGFHRNAGTSALPRLNIMAALLAGLFAVMAFLSQPAFAERQSVEAPLGLEWGMNLSQSRILGGRTIDGCHDTYEFTRCPVSGAWRGFTEFSDYVLIYSSEPRSRLVALRATTKPMIADPKDKHLNLLLEKYKSIIERKYGAPTPLAKRKTVPAAESYDDCLDRDDCSQIAGISMDPASASHLRCVYRDECAKIAYEWSDLDGWIFLEIEGSLEGEAKRLVISFYGPEYSPTRSRAAMRELGRDYYGIVGYPESSN